MDFMPQARTDGLLVEEIDDELLVYDQRDDNAHRLNRTAAIVWRACDGTRDVPALVALLAEENDLADEDLVLIALDDLAAGGLLEEAPDRSIDEQRTSRRRFIRRVGTVGGAAVALPIVRSIVAPTPAAAQTVCTTSSSPCASPCGRSSGAGF